MRNPIAATLICSLGLAGFPLQAEESAISPPAIRNTASGTPYLSGGVGDEELQQIEQAAKDFNLKLVMAEMSGAYATGVALVITDSKGNRVLDLPAAGPLLLTRLPGGSYRIDASYEGRTLQKTVNIRPGGQQQMTLLTW
ncbi:MAG: carboxypeptidase regulatory-like domain-containing protein [Bacteroidota bacterium]